MVIVGGVAAGATAAARIRRLSESVRITLLERGPYVSYANCGLPYYVGGDIKVREPWACSGLAGPLRGRAVHACI